ncbi:hypothetical protein GGX14DRAFT_405917 [Mycena pura]|uniref:Uncharacterized protein n=1 Tax=Mycena pura TaxID=153505 RepID=A0AAD6Y237_9AGAR|nr:hypothetical protein GGX14DRAFT_405917 [Mycena pura]
MYAVPLTVASNGTEPEDTTLRGYLHARGRGSITEGKPMRLQTDDRGESRMSTWGQKPHCWPETALHQLELAGGVDRTDSTAVSCQKQICAESLKYEDAATALCTDSRGRQAACGKGGVSEAAPDGRGKVDDEAAHKGATKAQRDTLREPPPRCQCGEDYIREGKPIALCKLSRLLPVDDVESAAGCYTKEGEQDERTRGGAGSRGRATVSLVSRQSRAESIAEKPLARPVAPARPAPKTASANKEHRGPGASVRPRGEEHGCIE